MVSENRKWIRKTCFLDYLLMNVQDTEISSSCGEKGGEGKKIFDDEEDEFSLTPVEILIGQDPIVSSSDGEIDAESVRLRDRNFMLVD